MIGIILYYLKKLCLKNDLLRCFFRKEENSILDMALCIFLFLTIFILSQNDKILACQFQNNIEVDTQAVNFNNEKFYANLTDYFNSPLVDCSYL